MIDDNGDLGWSVKGTAAKTAESPWQVRDHLRKGNYAAVKRGTRTIIIPASVKRYWATLPKAKFGAQSGGKPRNNGRFAKSNDASPS